MDFKRSKYTIQPTPDQMEYWFRANGVDYKIGTKDQFRICNPDGDTKFCVEVSKEKALVHDFTPNHQQYDGTFIRFVSKYKGISIQESIEEVCGKNIRLAAIAKKQEEVEEEIEDEIDLPSGCCSIRDESMFDTKMHQLVINYLIKDRCLDKEAVMKANIHYLGTSIVVPYYEYGMIVFWQMRQQLSKVFKFPPSSNKSAGDFLYGFDNVEPHSFVIVTEAIFNTLSIGDDCVATGGATLKSGQIQLLKALSPEKIILAPDNDPAGIKSLQKDYLALRKGKWDIYYCLPPYAGKGESDIDWNDLKKMGVDPREYILNTNRKLTMKDVFNGVDNKSFKMP